MRTDDLIRQLAADTTPVQRGAVGRRLLAGLVAGGLLSAVLLVTALGIRPDLDRAMLGPVFWLKWGYTLSLAAAALAVLARVVQVQAAAQLLPEMAAMEWLTQLQAQALHTLAAQAAMLKAAQMAAMERGRQTMAAEMHKTVW